ncbi:MAG: hypothetical protein F9K29_20985 [Hyphomicrobiaceae bacterium]|nr:MAG: hypothetical protein F9K29_20985 [Hyphomicrobiaceae bacterium]
MRLPFGIGSLALSVAWSVVFALISPADPATAQQNKPAEPPPCTCPAPSDSLQNRPRPKFAELKAELDENDEIAALEAIRVALTEVGDGSTYVWRRRHGRLNGIVRPTSSFKDGAGRVCRHIVFIVTAGAHTGKIEGVACRLPDGRWELDG